MITLNDYLYSGDTILRILQKYSNDLKEEALRKENLIDFVHADFLDQIKEILEHNDFLTDQAQRIRGFYIYMANQFPYLAFTFKGRIKSLIRTESKFNGYIVRDIYHYYLKHGKYPSEEEICEKLFFFRDFIAYRIVIAMPKCHLKDGEDLEETELAYLYKLANMLPGYLQEHGFEVKQAQGTKRSTSPLMKEEVKDYYRDYVCHVNKYGYRSIHITAFDPVANCHVEIQLRTKKMDDEAEIGFANHAEYEKRQNYERGRREAIPVGECAMFDAAFERGRLLSEIDLSKLDVNMFGATNNSLINDGCGLYRGRQIQPYEHLSRFQNDTFSANKPEEE